MRNTKRQRKAIGMGKTRDLFKKTGDIKEIFHGRMGTKKYRNGKDLTEIRD